MSRQWFQDVRQRFIEWRLVNYGSVCGRDIAETFGVSVSQGTIDIQAFAAAHPGALQYDTRAKSNIATPKFRSRMLPGRPLMELVAEPDGGAVTIRDRSA